MVIENMCYFYEKNREYGNNAQLVYVKNVWREQIPSSFIAWIR